MLQNLKAIFDTVSCSDKTVSLIIVLTYTGICENTGTKIHLRQDVGEIHG